MTDVGKKGRGRPVVGAKKYRYFSVRLSDTDCRQLDIVSRTKGISKAEVIRLGIETLFKERFGK